MSEVAVQLRTRRENREEQLRQLAPDLRNTDLSVLDDVQIEGLISAAARLRNRDGRGRRKKRHR